VSDGTRTRDRLDHKDALAAAENPAQPALESEVADAARRAWHQSHVGRLRDYSGSFGPKSRSWVQAHAMSAVVTGRRLSPLRLTYAASGLIAPPVHPPKVALADAALAFAQPPRAQSPCWRSARPVSKAVLRARRGGGASITFGRSSLARGSSWPPTSRSPRAPINRPSAAPVRAAAAQARAGPGPSPA
jgi:hypothetical protein